MFVEVLEGFVGAVLGGSGSLGRGLKDGFFFGFGDSK